MEAAHPRSMAVGLLTLLMATCVVVGMLLLMITGTLAQLRRSDVHLDAGFSLIRTTPRPDEMHHRLLSTLEAYEIHDLEPLTASLGLASAPNAKHTTSRRALNVNMDAPGGAVLRLRMLGSAYTIRLTPHDDLFVPGYEHVLLDENGHVTEKQGPLDCVYRAATLDGDEEMTGSFALCDGHVSGTLLGNTRAISIEPLTGVTRRMLGLPSDSESVLHVAFNHADIIKGNAAMGVHMPAVERIARRSRRANKNQAPTKLRPSFKLPSSFLNSREKVVELTVMNDKAFYDLNGASTHVQAAAIMAQAAAYHALMMNQTTRNGSFAAYYLTLKIQRMFTFQNKDPFPAPLTSAGLVDSSALLSTFGVYLGSVGLASDAGFLLSGSMEWDPALQANGWAYIGTMCDVDNRYNVGIAQAVFSVGGSGRITAHEIGSFSGPLNVPRTRETDTRRQHT